MDIVAADLSKDGCQFTAEQIRNARATLAQQLQSQAAEVERLRRELSEERLFEESSRAALDLAERRAEAAEADARRYRWLRANDNAYLLAEDVIDDALLAAGGES
jgi:hypothetical protein